MQEELTITEIAARLRVSERTALRRIEDGELSAERRKRNRYLVETADIEALAPRSQKDARTQEARITTLEEQVRLLTETIADMARQIADIEAVGLATQPLVAYKANRPRQVATMPPASPQRQRETPNPLKQPLTYLAAEMEVNHRTLRDFVLKHKIEHIAERIPGNREQYNHFFTIDQAQRVKQLWDEEHRN